MNDEIEVRFIEYPKERGYFCAGDMMVAWYMKPNWLFRLVARMAGWSWKPAK